MIINIEPAWTALVEALVAFEGDPCGPVYHWPVPEFEGIGNEGATCQERAISLRHRLSNELTIANTRRKIEIVRFYVQQFGGITADNRRSEDEQFRLWRHYAIADEDAVSSEFDRISSWSKVLALRNPARYLIYDSRVAKTINWIQLHYTGRLGLYFPMPGRRPLISPRPNDERIRNAKPVRRECVPRRDAYRTYLRLMREVQPDAALRERLEMKLFAQADYEALAPH